MFSKHVYSGEDLRSWNINGEIVRVIGIFLGTLLTLRGDETTRRELGTLSFNLNSVVLEFLFSLFQLVLRINYSEEFAIREFNKCFLGWGLILQHFYGIAISKTFHTYTHRY